MNLKTSKPSSPHDPFVSRAVGGGFVRLGLSGFLAVTACGLFVTSQHLAVQAVSAAELNDQPSSHQRPASFPHRIWAANDFERQTIDYAWFGRTNTNSLPRYAGNRTSLRAEAGPYQTVSAVMVGMNPVPGPRMGKQNGLFLRYFLTGGHRAVFQHFSLTREDNWHVIADNLTTGRWDEVTLDFTRNAKRNDGSAEPFGDGERMDDFKMLAGKPEQAAQYDLSIDDVIFFANDPALPPESEPFPNRVIFLAAFDTGPKDKYWPGDFMIEENPPNGAWWRAARSIPRKGDGVPMIAIPIEPLSPVGARTRLRFRYYLTGASSLVVQLFDATVQDNRHIRLSNLTQGTWKTTYLDFSRDSRRNDGTNNSTFNAGNLVDAVFFFVDGDNTKAATLYVDEVILFDGGPGTVQE